MGLEIVYKCSPFPIKKDQIVLIGSSPGIGLPGGSPPEGTDLQGLVFQGLIHHPWFFGKPDRLLYEHQPSSVSKYLRLVLSRSSCSLLMASRGSSNGQSSKR